MEYSRDKHSGGLLLKDRSEIEKCRHLIKEKEEAKLQSRHIESQDMLLSSLLNRITSLEFRVVDLENKLQKAQSSES